MTVPEDGQPLASLECVVLDCPDPGDLAVFYGSLLGGRINQPDPRWAVGDRWATLHTPTGLVLAFQAVDLYVPPRWPDPAHPQQVHLDFHVEALEPAHARVLALSGRLLESGQGWRVYADPAGHPFCLVGADAQEPEQPGNNSGLAAEWLTWTTRARISARRRN